MKGLIVKDFLCLRQSLLSYAFVLVMYLLLVCTGVWNLSTFGGVVAMLACILPGTAFSYDRAAKWDLYARTLPLPLHKIVLARYLGSLLCMALAALAVLLIGALLWLGGGLADGAEYLASCTAALAVGIAIDALMIPLLYRFGDAARIMFFALFALFVLAIALLVRLGEAGGWTMPQIHMAAAVVGALAGSLALLALSYLCAVRIYARRDA